MIQVFIVEDELFWQEAIIHSLSADQRFSIVGISSSLENARMNRGALLADVILVDVSIGKHEQGGIDLVYEWRAEGNHVPPMIMLTSHDDPSWIAECFAAGATNYLCKRDIQALPELILKLTQGDQGFISYVADALRMDYFKLRGQTDRDQLTRQERTILEYINAGYAQSRIADTIHISQRTIKNHVTNILRKLNVRSSKEAAERAAKRGWLNRNEEGDRVVH